MKKQEKRRQNDWFGTVSKVAVILVLILAVAGFTLNMGFFSIFKSVKSGSYVTIDYTLRNDEGRPVISSVQQVVENGYDEGYAVGYTSRLSLVANGKVENVTPVDVYYSMGTVQFALFGPEIETISEGIMGMHLNEQKTILFPFGDDLKSNITPSQFEMIGGNFSQAEVGDWIPLGFATAPIVPVGNETPEVPIRWAEVLEKGEDSLLLGYGYSQVDVIVRDISD